VDGLGAEEAEEAEEAEKVEEAMERGVERERLVALVVCLTGAPKLSIIS